MHSDEIILAVSSPPGRSMRGIIRASGAGSLTLLRDLCGDEPTSSFERGVHRVRTRLWGGITMPTLALIFPGPRSYTGEDVFELLPPGNPALLERIVDFLIDRAIALGLDARRATGGEFTARAFFNGRISLIEAEGINLMIAARSDAELDAAGVLTSGALGDLARSLADRLASALALVEAGIDFTDQEDVVGLAPEALLDAITMLGDQIERYLNRAVGFESLEAIPWVVLAGPPNAGKSTLFNALLGRERAVVSDIAGTTRDVLAEPITLRSGGEDREVMLVDIAGLDRESQAFLNLEMQEAADRALARAELVIECNPADGVAGDLLAPFSTPASKPVLRVLTKSDLAGASAGANDSFAIPVSAMTGTGLDALRAAMAKRLGERAVSLSADAIALLPRHEAALRSALSRLREAETLVQRERSVRALGRPEIVASLLRSALDDLGSLAGEVGADDILGRIFAGFCIGK